MKSIMHIDANSAYLSWSAVWLLEHGETQDLREVPAVVAGDPKSRHGIVLASSLPAKKFGIYTAMTLFEAKKCCPNLVVIKPDYDLYVNNSRALYNILYDFSPLVERYSIDECYMDYTASRALFGDPVKAAYALKDRVQRELGFTVNVGVSTNKLLAKMASELEKPNRVHTIYPSEVQEKMWPLDVQELFCCGRATAKKLRRIGINTIGELAQTNLLTLQAVLGSAHGALMYQYANGVDESVVVDQDSDIQKDISNSTTLPRDLTTKQEAYELLLAISERVGARLRKLDRCARLIGLVIRTKDLAWHQQQRIFDTPLYTSQQIYQEAKKIFDSLWEREPVRQLGIRLSELCLNSNKQMSIFETEDKAIERQRVIESAVDSIRNLYGENAIMRGTLTNVELPSALSEAKEEGNFRMLGGSA